MRLWSRRFLLAGIALTGIVLLLANYRRLLLFVGNVDQMRDWLVSLGPWGPFGLILLNAAQVVVAPVPGYFMQGLAGYLFGLIPGTLYGVLGMALGGAVAMTLGRVYGRPLVRRVLGAERMDRWEQATRVNSLALWTILLLGPLGDAPFFVAGLTSLAVWQVVLVASLVRVPTVLVSVAVGAGIVSWRSPIVVGGFALLIIVGVLILRYQDRIQRWFEERMLARVRQARQQSEPSDLPSE